ncbi:hypothetical protein ABZ923_30585 [Streptomyces sp. NPDC046881]|uniref:hypothetical protein n=1 Tax=Streptomyces sp. NPDC046881 TaxID=3155374 RepID=UPI0033C9C469
MTCVPNVTEPERTAVPPELRNATVTFWHQRRSVPSVAGVPQERSAGVAGGVVRLRVGPGEAAGGVVRPLRLPDGSGVPGVALPAGSAGVARSVRVGAAEPVSPAPVEPLGADEGRAERGGAPSSGTSVTDPDGRTAVGPPPPAPTAV